MALQKFPVVLPLGGAVDEGTVTELVQPPRIQEATDCASLKGGAYQKRDGDSVPIEVDGASVAIEHTGQETVVFQETGVTVRGDNAEIPASTPTPTVSGGTGRSLTGFRVTETDAVKQHGDQASLVLDSGQTRTLCLWNVDASGTTLSTGGPGSLTGPRANSSVRYLEDPTTSVNNQGYTYYPTGGMSGVMLEDGVPIGPEFDVQEEYSFPRVRANTDPGFSVPFVSFSNRMIPQALAPGPVVIPNSYGAHVDSFSLGNASPAGGVPPVPPQYSRDVLNLWSSLATLPWPSGQPGGQIEARDIDGNINNSRTVDASGTPLTPALELVLIPGEDTVYTLHLDFYNTLGPGNTAAQIIQWDISGTFISAAVAEIYVGNTNAGAPIGDFPVPAGLHDIGEGKLLLMWSDTTRHIIDRATFTAGPQLDRFWESGKASGLFIGRGGDLHARVYYTATPPAPQAPFNRSYTYRLARGAWAGSFCAPLDGGGFWVGVQALSDLDDEDIGAEGDDVCRDFPTSSYIGNAEQGLPFNAIPHPCNILHALMDSDGAVASDSCGVIQGSSILSQGANVPGIGACVAITATSTGDDRTAAQWKAADTLADAISPTTYLVARRRMTDLVGPSIEGYPDAAGVFGLGANGAIAVAQVLSFESCIGTTMINPYQVRVNLDVGDWGARWFAFQRYGVQRTSGDVGSPAYNPATTVTDDNATGLLIGAASQAAPFLLTWAPGETAETVRAGDYALLDGGMPVCCGTTRALAQGNGLQCIIDAIRPATAPNYAVTYPPGVPIFSPRAEGAGLSISSFTTTFDAVGGAHRSVPYTTRNAYQAKTGEAEAESPFTLAARLYPYPWQILGVPQSAAASIGVYVAPTGSGAPMQEALLIQPPALTHEMLITNSPVVSYDPNAPDADRNGPNTSGNQAALYTEGGELAADAPDPSMAQAIVNNRVWSLSGINRRTAQYSKLLRKGYAPEWNGNLTVRVPDTEEPLTAIGALPDGRILLFAPTAIYYTYGDGPSDTGQGAGFAEPQLLTDTVGCKDKRSVVYGDFGCMFQGERGFYLVNRGLELIFAGLPYEESTQADVVATAIDGLRSEVIFYSAKLSPFSQERWIYNYLRNQWSTFQSADVAFAATQKNGRPWTLLTFPRALQGPTTDPASITPIGGAGSMALRTGWLEMGRLQGFGRMWEVQLEGSRDAASLSGLRVQVYYDYDDTPAETFDYDEPGTRIKIRLRTARQKCESISLRFSEYAPSGADESLCTGWTLSLCTLLAGVKAGLDKIAVTEPST